MGKEQTRVESVEAEIMEEGQATGRHGSTKHLLREPSSGSNLRLSRQCSTPSITKHEQNETTINNKAITVDN